MKFTTIAAIATACLGVSAGPVGPRYPHVCGHWLVNYGGKVQSDIAKLACGRTDTCGGREWNTIFNMGLTGQWSASNFCSSGCYMYEDAGMALGACH
ncbi:hypothetical protein B0I35DRAFT_429409 [Stachybotrys elegans]|uniref:WSC domain-containing protein n=1 Tax=Stachybotrys elegans TaxID=80388 RepID=A0A8K0SS40_9HYPO|nr:hypothetical protein B0I35DRAFT_429409 [Stachybotrys elegans]